MTDRERFLAVMNYQPVDRPPLHLVGPWPDTLERWYGEGLARDTDLNEYFGVKPLRLNNISGETGVWPHFEARVISEDEEFTISTDQWGHTTRQFRNHTSMPEWLEYAVKTPGDLAQVLAERYDLSGLSGRYSAEWEAKVRRADDEDVVVLIDGGCYYNNLRTLAGPEVASYLFYDAPELVDELFERINLICLEGLRRASKLTQIDVIGFGEDIAFKTGPLISPAMFRKFILPRYRKFMDLAHELGIHLTWYDSDGDIRQFLPDYLEVGINLVQPCEVAASMSAPDLRREFGRELRMVGALDKREISKGPAAIDAEIERNRGVIEEGGFLPAIDHSVPADVSWGNYCYFMERIKKTLGLD
jgi:uroporphyrinogen decarboxylase